MVQEVAKTIIKQVAEQYPHIATPTAMQARITSARKLPKEFKEICRLKDASTGEEREYIVTKDFYTYGIKIVDIYGALLPSYPAIPNIDSRLQFNIGDIVTVVFTGGETTPSIVGG